jgi:acetyl esterase
MARTGGQRGRWTAIVLLGVAAALGSTAPAGVESVAAGTNGTSPPASATNSTIPASTAAVTVTPDVPYYDGGPTLDIYQPTASGSGRPAIVMVHSGGWSSGSSAEFAPWAMQVAEDQGWVAFSIDYRLDTDDSSAFPDELHDVQAAIRWVAANADRYDVDADKIVLLGGSAGGNLVTLVSSLGTANPVTGTAVGIDPTTAVKISAVAAWSPPVDLAPLVSTGAGQPPPGCDGDQECDFVWSSPDIVDYLGCEPTACPDTYKDASPISWVSSSTAPTFIANSSDELVPVDQIEQYVDALKSAGVANQFDEITGSLHSTQYGGEAWEPTVEFLARYVDPSAAAAAAAGAGAGADDDERGWLVGAVGVGLIVLLAVLVMAVVTRRRASAG